MKAAKIVSVVVVFIILGLVGFYSVIEKIPEPVIPLASNIYIKDLKAKIEHISKTQQTIFCDLEYRTIQNDIIGYAKAKKIDSAYEVNFLKELDYIYTVLFCKQAFYIFNGTEWANDKLTIIRSESKKLSLSKYIEDKTELNKIIGILAKYDEIVSFIANAHTFASYVRVTSLAQQFDITKTKSYIDQASEFISIDSLVKNCLRLQSDLLVISNLMYNKHKSYLANKVRFCTGQYKSMASYYHYYNNIYQPIFTEFELFENNIETTYSGLSADASDIDDLKTKMKAEGAEAKAFLNKEKQQ